MLNQINDRYNRCEKYQGSAGSSECGSAKKFRQCAEIVKNIVTKEVSLDILL